MTRSAARFAEAGPKCCRIGREEMSLSGFSLYSPPDRANVPGRSRSGPI